jgi:hypothetical protein
MHGEIMHELIMHELVMHAFPLFVASAPSPHAARRSSTTPDGRRPCASAGMVSNFRARGAAGQRVMDARTGKRCAQDPIGRRAVPTSS